MIRNLIGSSGVSSFLFFLWQVYSFTICGGVGEETAKRILWSGIRKQRCGGMHRISRKSWKNCRSVIPAWNIFRWGKKCWMPWLKIWKRQKNVSSWIILLSVMVWSGRESKKCCWRKPKRGLISGFWLMILAVLELIQLNSGMNWVNPVSVWLFLHRFIRMWTGCLLTTGIIRRLPL